MSSFVTIDDFEEHAKRVLSKEAFGYYSSGADAEQTLVQNSREFSKLQLLPYSLRDVSKINIETQFLPGTECFSSSPIGVAPTAMQRMAHPQGELATAKACQTLNQLMIVSTLATSSLREIRDAAPTVKLWFQLYVYKDREITLSLIRQAEMAQCQAIVVTIDAPIFGKRVNDVRNRFAPPPSLRLANLQHAVGKPSNDEAASSGINVYIASQLDPSLTWEGIAWLKRQTRLPVLLKGVLRPEEAKYGVERCHVDGIIVSNHGGRQVDTVPASIQCLPGVCDALRHEFPRTPVFLDGGIRRGTDVIKALALGATGVFVGRPILWGLAKDGQTGVEQILNILNQELIDNLKLCGVADSNRVPKSLLFHHSSRL